MSMKPKGRPIGRENIRETAEASPSRCPKCQSTRRGRYLARTVQAYAGENSDGPYTHIVRRRCRCLDCDQMRIDTSYENWPDGEPEGEEEEK